MAETIESLRGRLQRSEAAHLETIKEMRSLRRTFDVLIAADALDKNKFEKASDLVTGFERGEG